MTYQKKLSPETSTMLLCFTNFYIQGK